MRRLLYKVHIMIVNKEISHLLMRPKGFPIALWKPSDAISMNISVIMRSSNRTVMETRDQAGKAGLPRGEAG